MIKKSDENANRRFEVLMIGTNLVRTEEAEFAGEMIRRAVEQRQKQRVWEVLRESVSEKKLLYMKGAK
ncbi:hypothetical protein TSUD_390260 [Trifolium subterraneum]|uniref:Uncharacterized protein n=1 Tax=Trifolium subterraneum TaxID=3900 RepID=A0A2Z6PGD9_TRISU|nr:hypothetical protein TSUD_390260 [Trifolium subterraneum]